VKKIISVVAIGFFTQLSLGEPKSCMTDYPPLSSIRFATNDRSAFKIVSVEEVPFEEGKITNKESELSPAQRALRRMNPPDFKGAFYYPCFFEGLFTVKREAGTTVARCLVGLLQKSKTDVFYDFMECEAGGNLDIEKWLNSLNRIP